MLRNRIWAADPVREIAAPVEEIVGLIIVLGPTCNE